MAFIYPGLPPNPLPIPTMYGKTVYKYITHDGGPPCMGAPPPPPGPPAPPNPNPWLSNQPPPPPQPPNPWLQGAPQSAPGLAPPGLPPPLPAPPGPSKPPLSGNRVKGELASFPGRKMGYIFPRNNAVVHIFHENVVNKFPTNNGYVTVPTHDLENLWSAECVPCDMTISEFIEQIDCISRANFHVSYPRHAIGVQELLEEGHGVFRIGSKIMLDEPRANLTIGQIWPNSTGEAGQGKPPYIVRIPVCKSSPRM